LNNYDNTAENNIKNFEDCWRQVNDQAKRSLELNASMFEFEGE